MPKHDTIGYVKDEIGKVEAIQAGFIFPKKEVTIQESCPMKIRKGCFKCCKCKEFPDREECEYRIIEYS